MLVATLLGSQHETAHRKTRPTLLIEICRHFSSSLAILSRMYADTMPERKKEFTAALPAASCYSPNCFGCNSFSISGSRMFLGVATNSPVGIRFSTCLPLRWSTSVLTDK